MSNMCATVLFVSKAQVQCIEGMSEGVVHVECACEGVVRVIGEGVSKGVIHVEGACEGVVGVEGACKGVVCVEGECKGVICVNGVCKGVACVKGACEGVVLTRPCRRCVLVRGRHIQQAQKPAKEKKRDSPFMTAEGVMH